jgi:hypothetical protein
VLIAGALLYIGGTLDDIITAPLRVREHNERAASVGLAPLATRDALGLALAGRF